MKLGKSLTFQSEVWILSLFEVQKAPLCETDLLEKLDYKM